MDEVREAGPVLVEDAEGGVTSAGHLDRGFEHAAEEAVEIEIGDEVAPGAEHTSQRMFVEVGLHPEAA